MSRPAGPWIRGQVGDAAVREPVRPRLLGPARPERPDVADLAGRAPAASAGPASSSSWLITTTLSSTASPAITPVAMRDLGDQLGVPAEQVRPSRTRASAIAPPPTMTSFGTGHSTVITVSGRDEGVADRPPEQRGRLLAGVGDRVRARTSRCPRPGRRRGASPGRPGRGCAVRSHSSRRQAGGRHQQAPRVAAAGQAGQLGLERTGRAASTIRPVIAPVGQVGAAGR